MLPTQGISFLFKKTGAYISAGLCADVCNIHKRDFISAKPHPVSVEEQCDQMPSSNMEIERLRNIAVPVDNNVVPENNVGTPNTFIHSQRESSPVSFDSEPCLRTTPGTDRHSSPNTFIPHMDTPSPIFPEPDRLSDIPEDLIDVSLSRLFCFLPFFSVHRVDKYC